MSGSKIDKPNLTHTLCFMFSGKAGTGKSYSADLAKELCEKAGLKTMKAHFAYGVKETARFMGWTGQKDRRGRKLLQDIGKAGRAYDPDLWVRQTFNYIEESVGYPYDAIFIDDWRFKNEYDYIVNNELLYKVVPIRMDAKDRESLKGTPEYDDISETDLDDFDFPFNNYLCNEEGYMFYRSCLEDIVFRSFVQYSKE